MNSLKNAPNSKPFEYFLKASLRRNVERQLVEYNLQFLRLLNVFFKNELRKNRKSAILFVFFVYIWKHKQMDPT